MKTVGVALGVVGSFLNLYCAVLLLNVEAITSYPGASEVLGGVNQIIQTLIALKWILAAALFISAVLGAIGAATLCKKGAVSGSLFVFAAVLSAVTVVGILTAFCDAVGSIFAFISDKRHLQGLNETQNDDSDEYDMGI